MKQHRLVRALGLGLTLAGLCGAGPAAAMTVTGAHPPSHASVVNHRVPPAPPTLDLVTGRIEAVDPVQHTLRIGRQTVALDASRLQVFDAGGHRAGAGSLQVGSLVRFALDAGAVGSRRIVLIYIQARQ